MIRNLALGGLAAVALTAGLAGTTIAQPAAPPSPGAAMPTPAYVMAAAQSDEYERLAGQMAANKGRDSRVKDFGRMMVMDHTMSTQMIQKAVRASGMTPPPPPPLRPDQAQMISQLRSASGKDFDRMYIMQQVMAHQEALMLHQNYAMNGDAPALKEAANMIAPKVQQHLDLAQSIQQGLG